MANDRLAPRQIAQAAADGVALALKAREEFVFGPIHIICGLPAGPIYEFSVGGDRENTTVEIRESAQAN